MCWSRCCLGWSHDAEVSVCHVSPRAEYQETPSRRWGPQLAKLSARWKTWWPNYTRFFTSLWGCRLHPSVWPWDVLPPGGAEDGTHSSSPWGGRELHRCWCSFSFQINFDSLNLKFSKNQLRKLKKVYLVFHPLCVILLLFLLISGCFSGFTHLSQRC